MIKVDIDSLIKPEESYYSFVLGVAKRAREISDEQGKRIKEYTEMEKSKSSSDKSIRHLPDELSIKPVRLAIEELNDGKFKIEIGKYVQENLVTQTDVGNHYQYNMRQQRINSMPNLDDDDDDDFDSEE